jgi:hypothetical protein
MAPRFSILCRELGYQPATIEKQILRGHFKPTSVTTPGKARLWTIRDVYALAVFEILFGNGMPPDEACQLSYLMPMQHRRDAGPFHRAEGGEPAFAHRHQTRNLLLAWRVPGRWSSGWTHDVVQGDGFEFRSWASSKNISWALHVDLVAEFDRASSALLAASQIEVSEPASSTKTRRQTSAKPRPGPRR